GDQRVGVEAARPVGGAALDLGLARGGIGMRSGELLRDAVELERVDAQPRQRRQDAAAIIVMPAIPVRVACQACHEFVEAVAAAGRTRRGDRGHDAGDEIGMGDRPLEG
ncbi:MAG: hypothetical protein ACK55I_44910, partial [bacterium]